MGGFGDAVTLAGVYDILYFYMIVGEGAVYFGVVVDVYRSDLQ